MNLAELSWPAVKNLSHDLPVVVPIAAIEQHGPHLPLAVDSMLLGEVVRRAHELLGERALFTPQMWLGSSEHHLDFPGTLSAGPRTYIDLLVDLAENLLQHGFRRIVFLNGHGGNIVPSAQAVFELRQRHRERNDLLLLAATYWTLAELDLGPEFVQHQMGHACEWETSMMLVIAPHLVGSLDRLEPVPRNLPFEPATQGWVTRERSSRGYIGEPGVATAEKGEQLLSAFAAGVVKLVNRVANHSIDAG